MVEPLGVSASIVTLVGTAFTIAKTLHDFIKRLRHAPQDLLALSNEVSELSLILTSINHASSTSSHTATSQALTECLQSARQDLHDLDAFTKRLVISRTPAKNCVDRLAWARHKKEAVALQSRLRDSRLSLSVLLGASSV